VYDYLRAEQEKQKGNIMSPDDIHTIQQFIQYCREILALKPEYMSEKEQESPAAGIVGACIGEEQREWERIYPQFVEIFDIAAELEISNVANTTESWRRISTLVNELDRQVNAAKP
jgi:hypothetical protein